MNAQRKVAVITGVSRGIGAGLVRGFLDRGTRIGSCNAWKSRADWRSAI
jgi:NAD(P)-dependent dehydrogenase (short-subunit alcohol dehydrogenase family)